MIGDATFPQFAWLSKTFPESKELLHNLCIVRKDPCNPRWKLHVDEVSLVERYIPRTENKSQSREIVSIIAEWTWIHG